MRYFLLVGLLLLAGIQQIVADPGSNGTEPMYLDTGSFKETSGIYTKTLKREEEVFNLDGLNVARMKGISEKAEKFNFQTEVNRMKNLIIYWLYRYDEIFLRELISNASDANEKIRVLALTGKKDLNTNPKLKIYLKADKENEVLHIMDTGIGTTQKDHLNGLGTIAKSGTADFLSKMQDLSKADLNVMLGKFGIGFYSASLVEYTVRELIRKYSQFINFSILMRASKTVDEE